MTTAAHPDFQQFCRLGDKEKKKCVPYKSAPASTLSSSSAQVLKLLKSQQEVEMNSTSL